MDLIVSPHLDDEVLGASTFLQEACTVLYITEEHPLFPNGLNITESKRLQRHVGFAAVRHKLPTNRVATAGEAVLIKVFEDAVAAAKPDTVLLPFPSYNQDHRAIYEAALTALRVHDRNHFVRRILVYEESDVWGTLRKVDAFRPAYFRRVDMARKLSLWKFYQSQQRGHRTIEDIQAIAHVRGMQSHQDFAEAFEVLRWCE